MLQILGTEMKARATTWRIERLHHVLNGAPSVQRPLVSRTSEHASSAVCVHVDPASHAFLVTITREAVTHEVLTTEFSIDSSGALTAASISNKNGKISTHRMTAGDICLPLLQTDLDGALAALG